MTGQWREDPALAAVAYGCTVFAMLVAIPEYVSLGTPLPGWALAGVSTVLVLFGLLLGGAIYVRLKRGRWWTTGTVAGVTFVGVVSLLVGHLVSTFSAGYVSDSVVAATGVALVCVGLWQVTATADWPAPAIILRRQYVLAAFVAALGLAAAAATGLLAAGARWLLFFWATGFGWWLAPVLLVVGVTAARRADLYRAAAVAVATVGALVVAAVAPWTGAGLSTHAGCVGVWTQPTYSVDWSAPGVGWTDGCNSITSTVAPDVAVLGLGLLAIGLLGVAVGTRGVPRRDELPDGA